MENELQTLQAEIKKYKEERDRLQAIRAAKLELLREKVLAVHEKFKANHPILTFLAQHGYSGSQTAAKEGAKTAKRIGSALWHGTLKFAKYAAFKKAQQYRREGKIAEAQMLEERVKRMRV